MQCAESGVSDRQSGRSGVTMKELSVGLRGETDEAVAPVDHRGKHRTPVLIYTPF